MSSPYQNKLVIWFSEKFANQPSDFPGLGKRDYAADYLAVDAYLNAQVHGQVSTHARIADSEGYLTDHGPDHIQMVMHRACKILASDGNAGTFPQLSPYEAFLLLMAIHFHDVGNRYGRAGHEQRILDVMDNIPQMGAFPVYERHTIARIASAHGGTVNDDRDTIQRLLPDGPQTSGGVTYRPQALAAILRLADELAEDNSRADNFALLLSTGIPEESKIYHKFAQRLDSVAIDPSRKVVDMKFSLYGDDIAGQFGKKKERDGSITKVYLLDEIFERTKKTFFEAIYCNRFLRDFPDIGFSAINVKINAYEDSKSPEPFRMIQYSLKERGYPFQGQTIRISDLCPDLKDITGTSLKKELEAIERFVT